MTAVTKALMSATTHEWINRLAPLGIPVAEVRELPDVIADPQFEGRNAFVTLPSPVESGGTITVAKAGYVTDADGPSVRYGPPKIGEHSEEILSTAGYSQEDIATFRADGVI